MFEYRVTRFVQSVQHHARKVETCVTHDFISTDAYVAQFRSHPEVEMNFRAFTGSSPAVYCISGERDRRSWDRVRTRIEKFVNHFISTFHRDTTRYTIARTGISSNGVKVSIEFHIDLPPPRRLNVSDRSILALFRGYTVEFAIATRVCNPLVS